MSNAALVRLFFSDLKNYNSTNYRTLVAADLSAITPTVYKSFSSVITRYFIFAERHPELSPSELKMLYYKLKIDMVALFFSSYPDVDIQLLIPFQLELKRHTVDNKEVGDEYNSPEVQHI